MRRSTSSTASAAPRAPPPGQMPALTMNLQAGPTRRNPGALPLSTDWYGCPPAPTSAPGCPHTAFMCDTAPRITLPWVPNRTCMTPHRDSPPLYDSPQSEHLTGVELRGAAWGCVEHHGSKRGARPARSAHRARESRRALHQLSTAEATGARLAAQIAEASSSKLLLCQCFL